MRVRNVLLKKFREQLACTAANVLVQINASKRFLATQFITHLDQRIVRGLVNQRLAIVAAHEDTTILSKASTHKADLCFGEILRLVGNHDRIVVGRALHVIWDISVQFTSLPQAFELEFAAVKLLLKR